MHSAGKPVWQQLTALVSLGASGAVTGFTFTPRTAADLTSPASLPVHLLALAKAAKPATADDAPLRSAIVNFAHLFLRMAGGKTPAQMESIIWQHDSVNGVDHGQSCAAFASLTLELAAQAVGQHSWVTGGTSYPWPLHKWVDARVEPNPASPGITSVQQDAEAHHRWHPLGDGYRPLPGDWVLFPGHIEVVTKYAGEVLSTIGGDSLPNFSVNAHQYHGPLGALGVAGFVNNGGPTPAGLDSQAGAQPPGHWAGRPRPPAGATETPAAVVGPAAVAGPAAAGPSATTSPGRRGGAAGARAASAEQASPANELVIPGLPAPGPPAARQRHAGSQEHHPLAGADRPRSGSEQPGQPRANAPVPAAASPGVTADPMFRGLLGSVAAQQSGQAGTAPIPGLPIAPLRLTVGPPHQRPHLPPAHPAVPETPAERAFINQIAPGAVDAQRRYGVPASVTIAQAIVESGWGQSQLASQDHNLFGIKGTGPAGSVQEPSSEYLNGQSVMQTSSFRVYRSAAESIDDHGKLLATSDYYRRTMSHRRDPNAFASSLTGVYATDPEYGTKLISLMRRYNLYRYDEVTPAASARPAPAGGGLAAGPVPPATPPAPISLPATSSSATPRSPVTGPASPEPGTQGPASSAQPVATLPVSPGPVPSKPAPDQTPPEPAVTPGPVVSFPVSPEPAVSPPDRHGPAVSWPGRSGAVASSPDRTGPGVPGPDMNGQAPSSRAAGAPPAGRQPAAAPAAAPPPARPHARAPHPATPWAPAPHPATPWAPIPHPATPRAPAPHPATPRAPAPQPAGSQPGRFAGFARPAGQPAAAGPAPGLQPGFVPPVSAPSAAAMPARTTRPGGVAADRPPAPTGRSPAPPASPVLTAAVTLQAVQFRHQIPLPVRQAFTSTARATLLRAEPLYRDVASDTGIDWRLLAACDWMQCEARPRYSPVHGERLGTVNPDGTVYRTKSAALAQCAIDLVNLAVAVYGIDLASAAELSVRELASAYAAFRWGGLLRAHQTSAMEFPYSVAGLTDHHTSMRWPDIADPNTPDKPGSRFRKPFGAVPIVLSLNFPATV